MTADNALRLEQVPSIGPVGLVTNTPERVHPITNADVYEVLRWMHADLKAIHRAFRHVADIRRDLESTRLLYHKQAAAVLRSVEQHEGIASRVAKMESQSRLQQAALERLSLESSQVSGRLEQMQASIDALTAQLAIPWWKRLLGRTS